MGLFYFVPFVTLLRLGNKVGGPVRSGQSSAGLVETDGPAPGALRTGTPRAHRGLLGPDQPARKVPIIDTSER